MVSEKISLKWAFILSASCYYLQGIESLPGQAFFYYLKETLHFTPSKIMYLSSIIGIAWIIKPLLGYLIDLLKWKKKTWILIALLIDILLALSIGLSSLPLIILITFFTIKSTCAAFRDISVDGIMVVEGQKNNCCGKIQAVQWISITIACIITGMGGGYIAEKFNYQVGYLLLIPIFIIVGIITFLYKEEDSISDRLNLKKVKNLIQDKRYLIGGILFLFFYCFSPSFGTPLMFIQRDEFHWSKLFIGILGTVVSVVEIIGALLYYKFSKRINVRKWLIGSVYLGATTTMCYLYYTPLTAIVYSVLFCLVGMFIHLIILDYTARIIPKGLETTAFALLCSVINLSSTTSNITGAWLLPIVGLKPLIIISSLTSFLCLAFIKYVRVDNGTN